MADSDTLAVLAALITGDRWLNADAAAVHLGMIASNGKPNRRGFLERAASRADFPEPLFIGQERKWRKSDIDKWALRRQRQRQPKVLI